MKVFLTLFLYFISSISTFSQKKNIEKIYTKFAIRPVFKGNWTKLMEENLKFPDEEDGSCQGTVIIEFAVKKDGTVTNITLAKESPNKCTIMIKSLMEIIKKTSGNWVAATVKKKRVHYLHKQAFNICALDE